MAEKKTSGKSVKDTKQKENYYITTAIDYPNGEPHIGHAYEKIIADVYARWSRLLGNNVYFLTGTDENSQKIVDTANKKGIDPKIFLENNVARFKELLKVLNISNDDFIRTTQENHKKFAREVMQKAFDKKDIYLGKYKGKYCKYEENFLTEKDLVNDKCPICGREVVDFSEPAYFFKLGKYQKQIIDAIKKDVYKIIPESRKNEVLSRLKEKLHDLCVTRSGQEWGIKVPFDEKHVIYVWFDALFNYISGAGKNAEKWPADVHVIGKDITFFHAVYWPAFLLSVGYDLPKRLYVHGFINVGGEKLSKSKGLVINPFEYSQKFGEGLRYYLAKVPSGNDGDFTDKGLIENYNNELANDFGNLIKRITTLVFKEKDKEFLNLSKRFKIFRTLVLDFVEAEELMQNYQHDKGLESIWLNVKKINQYFTEKEPWSIKDDDKRQEILYNILENIRFVCSYLNPFIPSATEKIAKQLGFEILPFAKLEFGKGKFDVKDAPALFPKIEIKEKGPVNAKAKEKDEKKKSGGEVKNEETENIFPARLVVGKILSVSEHPEAEKLYVLKVDLAEGEEPRQLVAGIRKHYSKDSLIGKKIIVVSNLKKAKLRGIESQGMLLAAEENLLEKGLSKNGKLGLLTVEGNEDLVGKIISVGELKIRESRIEIEDFLKLGLKAKDGKIVYSDKSGDKILTVNGEEIFSEGVKNGNVA